MSTYSAMREELEKIAAAEPEEVPPPSRGGNIAAGTTLLGAGTYAGLKAAPIIGGRTKLYHGTTPEAAALIQQEGLIPNKGGISAILPMEGASKAVYLTGSKPEARQYAAQADAIAPVLAQGLSGESIFGMKHSPLVKALAEAQDNSKWKQLVRRKNPFANRGVVTANVPLWEKEIAGKLVQNPETAMGFDKWVNQPRGLDFNWMMMGNAEKRQLFDRVNDVVVHAGVLPANYIKGKNYKRVGLGEIIRHAKAKPGKAALGAGLGLGGLGLGALGAHYLHKGITNLEPEPQEAVVT